MKTTIKFLASAFLLSACASPTDGLLTAADESTSDWGDDTTETSDGTAEGTGDGDGDGDGDGTCVDNTECLDTEVCGPSGACVDAHASRYDVRITAADGLPCDDGVGGVEMFYQLRDMPNGTILFTSSISDCPLGWPDFATELVMDGVAPYEWMFIEEDPVINDPIDTFCWSTMGTCGPIPKDVLHDGEWSGTWGSTGMRTLTMTFDPVI